MRRLRRLRPSPVILAPAAPEQLTIEEPSSDEAPEEASLRDLLVSEEEDEDEQSRAVVSYMLGALADADTGALVPFTAQDATESTEIVAERGTDVLTLQPLEPLHLEWTSPDGGLRLHFNVCTVEAIAAQQQGQISDPPHFRGASTLHSRWRTEVVQVLRACDRESDAARVQAGGPLCVLPAATQTLEAALELSAEYGSLVRCHGVLGTKRLYVCPFCYDSLSEQWCKSQLSSSEAPEEACSSSEDSGPREMRSAGDEPDPDPLEVLAAFRDEAAAAAVFHTLGQVKQHLIGSRTSGGHGLSRDQLEPADVEREEVAEFLAVHGLRNSDSIIQRWLARKGSQGRYLHAFDVRTGVYREIPVHHAQAMAFYWAADGWWNTQLFLELYSASSSWSRGGGAPQRAALTGRTAPPLPSTETSAQDSDSIDEVVEETQIAEDARRWAELLGVSSNDTTLEDGEGSQDEAASQQGSAFPGLRPRLSDSEEEEERFEQGVAGYLRSLRRRAPLAGYREEGSSEPEFNSAGEEEGSSEEAEESASYAQQQPQLHTAEESCCVTAVQLPSSTARPAAAIVAGIQSVRRRLRPLASEQQLQQPHQQDQQQQQGPEESAARELYNSGREPMVEAAPTSCGSRKRLRRISVDSDEWQ
ncbi:unnamed protein product [Polarella glacialis]|uniref:Uncharacterized protein n=1 Tax=Polarella glacialis TaxID=89957 RepID=A0A813DYF4_POLGL|nr:unnamed protein product [Polarella glacialis]